MYITVDRNNRGNLEISNRVLDKLVEAVASSAITKPIKSLEIMSEISHDNLLYLIVKVKLKTPKERIDFNEKKINKAIEEAVQSTLNFKPKNIAIVYLR